MKKISGIYIIKNNINDKVYIGSAVNCHRRFIQPKKPTNLQFVGSSHNIFIKPILDDNGYPQYGSHKAMLCGKKINYLVINEIKL